MTICQLWDRLESISQWGNALRMRAWARLIVELKIRDAPDRSFVYLSLSLSHYKIEHDDEYR
jgi:hypothetical protein